MNKAAARELLRQFDFKSLFLNELGWDDHDGSLFLKVGEDTITLTAVAEKRGMAAYLCAMPGQGRSYDYQTRCKVEIQLAKSVREHLVIYADSNRRLQTWQWVKREPGKPIARREHTLAAGQPGEALLQKLEALEIKIDEEDQLTLVGITARARQAFDVDRVTKRFYDRFKTEHAAFLKQIEGIDDKDECEWYASIMLNRLKFVYFIQKKGFLDQDKDYLRNRLAMVQKTRPKTKFLGFYRAFLLKLFHDGLGRRERSPELRALLGTVPYLNGGIFAVHPLEEQHTGIDIPNKAFEKVFTFFDQYRWHLDERPLRADDEINPDVLGYIFEKYINQKQMGAYYTKEDITEYIAKNCIVPFILDRVETDLKKKGKEADFRALFQLLAADPDRYVYDPVKHGVALPLPPEIEKGVDTKKPNLLERRAAWNKPAPSEYALPTEIWREVVTRRQRYADLVTQLTTKNQELRTNDLITLNLNIRQFAQDCIENAATPDVLWAFWQAIEQITVLDPTCGSGAFLFAAVNVLEPLYEACLDRMKAFMLEWSQSAKVPHPNYYKDFAAVIARVEKHANEKYFIFKSIIIRNLYGVDIMDEAVEICKLRLFLKLAAQIEPDYTQDNLGIEPLPDIDFNIRAGNTLVGFATEKQAEDVIRQDLLAYNTVWPEVQKEAQEIAEMFALFRQQQTDPELGGAVNASDKKRLRAKLAPLEDRLNAYLADTYGVTAKKAIKDWVHSHKPFHWFIEFYEIVADGGFDTVFGNPPYVEYSKIRKQYSLPRGTEQYQTNLYSVCCYRAETLRHKRGRAGFIVPVSMPSTDRMKPLRQALTANHNVHHSSFGIRPSRLFDGAEQRLTIYMVSAVDNEAIYSGGYLKWYAEERPQLFQVLNLTDVDKVCLRNEIWGKIRSPVHVRIIRKMLGYSPLMASGMLGKGRALYYKNTGLRYFSTVTRQSPKCWINGKPASSSRETTLDVTPDYFCAVHCLLLSSTFFVWWETGSNGRDLNPSDIQTFPVPNLSGTALATLRKLSDEMERDYTSKAKMIRMKNKLTGVVELESLTPADSKPIIDEIDRVLAKHYGFTDEELDFIINYDIKYRMGRNGGEAEEE